MSFTHWFILIMLGAAFGSSFCFNEILLSVYGPLTVSALRVGVGALGCWAWIIASGRRANLGTVSLLGVAIFGVFQYAAPFAFLPLAQQHVTISIAGITNAMTPVAVVVISQFWPGGERVTLARLFGIGFGVCGMVILITQGGASGESRPSHILVAALAPVCYGIALNLVRRFRAIDPVVLTAYAMTGGALAILPLAFTVEGVPTIPSPGMAGALTILGIGLTTVAFLIMYSILPKVGATNLSLVTFIAPISAAMIGAMLFDETLDASHFVGMGLILSGLVAIDGRVWRLIHPVAGAGWVRLKQAP